MVDKSKYINYLNHFWNVDSVEGISPIETKLYLYILNLFNRTYWQRDWIICGDDRLKAIIPCSSATLRNARNNLKNVGLINFIIGGKGHRVKTRYQILPPKFIPKSAPMDKPKDDTYNKSNTKINTSPEGVDLLKEGYPPNDGVDRNWDGLKTWLLKMKATKEQANEIIILSNFGEKGMPVWKLFAEIRDSGGVIKQPILFVLSRLKK